MTTDFERALVRAGTDLRLAVDRLPLPAMPEHGRSEPKRLALAAAVGIVTVVGVSALVALRERPAFTPADQPTIVAPDAKAQLRADLVAVASELGWGDMGAAPWDARSNVDADLSTYTDVTITPAPGETYLVSVRDNAPGWTGHDQNGLLQSVDGVDVLLRTHNPEVVSVELYDADTIMYLRSESQSQHAQRASSLLAAVVALHARWEQHSELDFGSPGTTPAGGHRPDATIPPEVGPRVQVQATNGEMGYVDRALVDELTGATVGSPDEAVAWTEWRDSLGANRIEIPVFDETGTRQIGVFPIDSTRAAKP